MIHRYLACAIQNDQGWRCARPVGVEVLFAQRHRHILQAGIIARADSFDIRTFRDRRSIRASRRITVELSRPDDD